MASKEKRSGRRSPVMLRIKLRYPDVDTFVGKFATNISRGGMFIASRKPKPVGEKIRFELQLADGSSVIAGEGTVRWIHEFDESNPRQPHGMGIEFTRLSDESAAAIEQIIERRKQRGLDEHRIPLSRDEDEPPEAEEKPKKKKAKDKAKDTKKKKKKKASKKAAKAPKPEPEPEPEPAPAPAPVPVPIDLADTDRQLAAILETDAFAITLMIRRAREIAYAAGGDSDVEALLRVSPSRVPSSVADASNELSALTGAPAPPERRAPPEPEPPAEEDPPTLDEPVDLGIARDLESDDDDLASGTPPPPPDFPEEAAEPEAVLRPRSQPDDATFVETSPPESGPIEFNVESTPLPPPKPPPDELSHELAGDALDADDLMASGLDDLPSGNVPALEDNEFAEEAPTNVVDRDDELLTDGEIPTEVVPGDDEEIHAALAVLSDDPPTAVDDEGIEIDFDDDDVQEIASDEEDPDQDPDKKKGFFKRIFGKN